jgi:aminoglycoside phosphotransferase (APT) family kinase protein
MSNQDGLEWIEHLFHGLVPRWTKEPDIGTILRIARKHLGCDEEMPCEVTFHAEGAFNKLYRVSTSGADYMLRVSLPVDPHHKTESEIATIEHVRRETDMPVPHIMAYDSDNSNELGFEWILMEMMPGSTVYKRWRQMSWAAKEEIVRQCAKFQVQLFQKQFDKIGNIFPHDGSGDRSGPGLSIAEDNDVIHIGRIVSTAFFLGDHLTQDAPRGPFETSLEWLQTRLQFALNDQHRIIATGEEDDIEDEEYAIELGNELAQFLPTIITPDTHNPERTILFHHDLSMQNMLIDDNEKLTAVLDWECVSAVPLWCACQFPQFLQSRVREERPRREEYSLRVDEPSYDPDEIETDERDHEGITILYWEHMEEYELTQLRRVFLSEMETLSPEWAAIMKESTFKADCDLAVDMFDDFFGPRVGRWLEAYKEGNVVSLSERLSF